MYGKLPKLALEYSPNDQWIEDDEIIKIEFWGGFHNSDPIAVRARIIVRNGCKCASFTKCENDLPTNVDLEYSWH